MNAPTSEVVDLPSFRQETDALLARFDGPAGPADEGPYQALLRDRLEPPDPLLAGHLNPATRPRDLKIDLGDRVLEARVYLPAGDEPRPVLLWLHGGGFIGGDLRDIEYAASGLAIAGDAVVVSLNYRLAPEHPYPAGLQDTLDTLDWLREHAGEVQGDGRIAVGGQSAGAALAAGACLVARDNGAPLPDRQVLCYPSLDLGQDTESFRLFDGVFLSIVPDWADEQYFPAGELPAAAVPLRAKSLAGLPPALILAAGRDPLREDARTYADRLAADGVPARIVEYADTMHAFLNFPAVLSAGRHAVGLIGADLRDAFPTRGSTRTPTTSAADAVRLIRADRQLLFDALGKVSDPRAPYVVADGPLGHFCQSLHDLVAHILMWDEITLAVLREAAAGRTHWSLAPQWETVEAGRGLNAGGVDAGRHLPSALLIERLHSVVDALTAEMERYDEQAWTDPSTGGGFDGSIGALAEYAATPPDGSPYGHVSRHLR